MNIYTVIYNNLDFLALQKKTLDKFIKHDFTFHVIDNTKNQTYELKKICNSLNITHIEYSKSFFNRILFKNPSMDHSLALNSILKKIDFNEINMFIDSDIFLMKEFSLNKLKIYGFYGVEQIKKKFIFKKKYFWPGLFIINSITESKINKINLNFKPTKFPINTDSGGGTSKLVEKYKDKCFFFDYGSVNNMNIEKKITINPPPFMFDTYLDNTFIHFGGGSNWYNEKIEIYNERKNFLFELIDKFLKK